MTTQRVYRIYDKANNRWKAQGSDWRWTSNEIRGKIWTNLNIAETKKSDCIRLGFGDKYEPCSPVIIDYRLTRLKD